MSQEDKKIEWDIQTRLSTSERMVQKIIYELPDVIMARWDMDGKLWRNISGCRIMGGAMKTLYTSHAPKCGGLVPCNEVCRMTIKNKQGWHDKFAGTYVVVE